MRPSGTSQQLEQRRLRAVRLLAEGVPTVEVARRLGADRRSVRRWKAAARTGGEAALVARPAPGRPRRLEARDLARLPRLLARGAVAAGLPTDSWTCPRVAWLIRREFGVQFHPAHVGRLLHHLGFAREASTWRACRRVR